MAHAQKTDFVFRRNGRVHLNRRGRQFSRLLATEVCASALVMLDTPCSEVVWRVLATHCIRQFPLHFAPVRHCVPSHFNWTLPPTVTLPKCTWTAPYKPSLHVSTCWYVISYLDTVLTVFVLLGIWWKWKFYVRARHYVRHSHCFTAD